MLPHVKDAFAKVMLPHVKDVFAKVMLPHVKDVFAKVMLPHVKDAFAKVMLPHVKVAFATYHHHHHHHHNLCEMLCIGEGLEYMPFHDLRSGPEAGRLREQVENHGRACTQVLYLRKAELGFFHFLETVTGWLVGTFSWSEDPSTAWLVPSTAEDPTCWKHVSSGR
jgi:hypothetical protein